MTRLLIAALVLLPLTAEAHSTAQCLNSKACNDKVAAAVAAQKAVDDAVIAALEAQIAALESSAGSAGVAIVTAPITAHAPIGQAVSIPVATPDTGSIEFRMPVRAADGTIPASITWVVTNDPVDPTRATITATAETSTPVTGYLRVQAPGQVPVDTPIVMTGDAATQPTWTFCAMEYQTCSFTGTKTVRYGIDGAYVQKVLTGGTPCNNAVFGDPAFGATKHCDYQ